MATGATIHRADLSIADMDRNYYADHSLTIARHPSETAERLMVRLLAFAVFADPALEFGRGLSSDDEADLWKRDLTGLIELWIDVGLPEEKWLRKACGRARQVVVIAYGAAKAEQWWKRNEADLDPQFDQAGQVAEPEIGFVVGGQAAAELEAFGSKDRECEQPHHQALFRLGRMPCNRQRMVCVVVAVHVGDRQVRAIDRRTGGHGGGF